MYFLFTSHVNQITTYADDRKQVCTRMTGLATKCVHPTTKQNYFKSYSGGKNNSTEGHDGGFTHGFVCEFQNAEDRDYYISKDPAHLEFVASLEGVVKDVRVVDYEPGVF